MATCWILWYGVVRHQGHDEKEKRKIRYTAGPAHEEAANDVASVFLYMLWLGRKESAVLSPSRVVSSSLLPLLLVLLLLLVSFLSGVCAGYVCALAEKKKKKQHGRAAAQGGNGVPQGV